jgi:hypothetical protein
LVDVGFTPESDQLLRCREMTRMGWTGRAPALDDLQGLFWGF